ncbi:hypothetical protein ACHAXS_011591 [Conticribra weissflogii]
MFHKEGTSTSGGKKDAPLRKSDRRKLRDRALDALFLPAKVDVDCGDNDNGTSAPEQEWIRRAHLLMDDAIVSSRGGEEILSRKLKLASGENVTLFLRTASSSQSAKPSGGNKHVSSSPSPLTHEELLKAYPTTWPYHQSTQPVLLEMEDADRKVHLIPLLPLLAALPPPSSVAAAIRVAATEESNYRIPDVVIHPQVTKYLCRGADLMKSGMRSFPAPWTLRQSKGVVTVSVEGNPMVCAVGLVDRGLFRDYCYGKKNDNHAVEASDWVGPGKKGVGVRILTCYGDDLWKSGLLSSGSRKAHASLEVEDGVDNPLGGGKFDDGNWGNLGFVDGKFVASLVKGVIDDDDDDESDDNDESEEKPEVERSHELEPNTQNVLDEMEQMALNQKNDESAECGQHNDNSTHNLATTDEPSVPDNQNDETNDEAIPPNHDEILSKAFFTSLLQILSSKTPLPISVSTYFAKHLVSAISPNSPRLDMKRTSYKKVGPFLLEMESKGIIKLGARKDGKDRCAFLVGIVKQHPDLVEFKRQFKQEVEAGGVDASIITSGPDTKKKMAVVDLFIVPRHMSDGLQLDKDDIMAVNAKTEERKGTGFLTKAECRALIEGYIEKEELADTTNRGNVIVNGPLCDALYRVSKKDKKQSTSDQESGYPTSVKRKDLIERWMDRMDKGHALVEMPGSTILHLGRGEANPVSIEVEFRQGNKKKFLTRVRGMEEYGIDAESLSAEVSNRFACSSTVETNPVGRATLKKGRAELVFQGHLSEELTALLTGDEKLSGHGGAKGSDYCLPKNVIKVTLRKGVPARKKR